MTSQCLQPNDEHQEHVAERAAESTEPEFTAYAALPGRRLCDLAAEADFIEIQIQAIRDEAGAHLTPRLAERLNRCYGRLQALESRMRLLAVQHGEDPQADGSMLRRRFRHFDRRSRSAAESGYDGPERRRNARREADRYIPGNGTFALA